MKRRYSIAIIQNIWSKFDRGRIAEFYNTGMSKSINYEFLWH